MGLPLAIALLPLTTCGRSGDTDEFEVELNLPLREHRLACGVEYDVLGRSPSLALSAASGLPRLAFFDTSKKALMYVEATSVKDGVPVWGPMVKVDPPDDESQNRCPPGDGLYGVGNWSALVLDQEDRPHIAYYDDAQRQLKYAWAASRGESGTWQFTRVYLDPTAANVGRYVSAVLDHRSPQTIHIAFQDSEAAKIRYLTWDRAGDLTASENRCAPKLAPFADACPAVGGYVIDQGGLPGFPETGKPLGGTDTAIAISSDQGKEKNTIYIAYYSASDGDLRLAFKSLSSPSDAAWKVKVLDDIPDPRKANEINPNKPPAEVTWDIHPENVGFWPAMALDSRGNVHLSYFDLSNKDLKYVMYEPTSANWFPRLKTIKNFDLFVEQTVMELAPLNDGGTPREFVVKEKKLTDISGIGKQVAEMWIGSVDGVGNVVEQGSGIGAGLASSITIGPADRPIISYKDGGTGELKVAAPVPEVTVPWGYTWAIFTLARSEDAGNQTSITAHAGATPEEWVIGLSFESFEKFGTKPLPTLRYHSLADSRAIRDLFAAPLPGEVLDSLASPSLAQRRPER